MIGQSRGSAQEETERKTAIKVTFEIVDLAFESESNVFRESRESISVNKSSSTETTENLEPGTMKKDLRSHPPTCHSINILKNRVKRREAEMKKRWESPINDEENIRKVGCEAISKAKERHKKPRDNYKEVFPEITLSFCANTIVN
ncbi:hypothetical protein KIN20_020716 [Parelaphostrongylus tenuis]|uniref:Uncharacterized protein n=1 Tax=Parelaphostrongylus tenuis TaxID=148309 RepID=A0AAD5N688_PARTN|nr:hypothetical protein KIN20_020716 [Parelaphostrongylus tenuis]